MGSRRKRHQIQILTMFALSGPGSFTKILDRVLNILFILLDNLRAISTVVESIAFLKEGFLGDILAAKIAYAVLFEVVTLAWDACPCFIAFCRNYCWYNFLACRCDNHWCDVFFLLWALFLHAHSFCSCLNNLPDFENITTHSGLSDQWNCWVLLLCATSSSYLKKGDISKKSYGFIYVEVWAGISFEKTSSYVLPMCLKSVIEKFSRQTWAEFLSFISGELQIFD